VGETLLHSVPHISTTSPMLIRYTSAIHRHPRRPGTSNVPAARSGSITLAPSSARNAETGSNMPVRIVTVMDRDGHGS
jgi:hypothetical protein